MQLLEHQQRVIEDLSTPLLTISATAVMMPIVGTIDDYRIQRILDVLLQGVAKSQASVIILDITGVPVVDTYIAAALIWVSRAVKLLGAQVVLTGIRPEVAQSVVELGVNLSGIRPPRSNGAESPARGVGRRCVQQDRSSTNRVARVYSSLLVLLFRDASVQTSLVGTDRRPPWSNLAPLVLHGLSHHGDR